MVTLAAGRTRPWRAEHVFFSGAALLMVAVIAFGFAPSFYLRGVIPRRHPLEPLNLLVIAHGCLFTLWLLLFVAQALLVAFGRIAMHRRVGTAGFILLPILAAVAVFTSLGGSARPLTAPEGVPPLSWLAISLLDIPVFTTLIALGLASRFRSSRHKRYLYIAMADMMGPGFGRMPVPVPPALQGPVTTILMPGLFLLALIAWDIRSTGRPLAVTLWSSAAVIGMDILKPIIWFTPAWLAFATWITQPFR